VLWAKAAIVGGLLLVGATFAVSVGDLRLPHTADPAPTAPVGQHARGCGTLIPSSWLVAGTSGSAAPAPRTAAERRAAAKCATAVHRARMVMWGVMGLGALAVLVGWTALREREESPRGRPRVVPV